MAAHHRRKVFEGFQCGNRGAGGSWGNRGTRGCSPGPRKREERRCRGDDGEDRRRVAGGARGRAAVEVGAESSGLGEVPGVEAEPWRRLAVASTCHGIEGERRGRWWLTGGR